MNKTRAVRQRAAVVGFLFLYGVAVLWRNPRRFGELSAVPYLPSHRMLLSRVWGDAGVTGFPHRDFASVITYNVLFLPALFLVGGGV